MPEVQKYLNSKISSLLQMHRNFGTSYSKKQLVCCKLEKSSLARESGEIMKENGERIEINNYEDYRIHKAKLRNFAEFSIQTGDWNIPLKLR